MRASELSAILAAKVAAEGDGFVVDCAGWHIVDVVSIIENGVLMYDFVSAPE